MNIGKSAIRSLSILQFGFEDLSDLVYVPKDERSFLLNIENLFISHVSMKLIDTLLTAMKDHIE